MPSMMVRILAVLAVVFMPVIASAQSGQPGPSPRRDRVRALETMISGAGQASIDRFIEEHVDTDYIERMERTELVALLKTIRRSCSEAGAIMVEPAGANAVRVLFETMAAEHTVFLRLQSDAPHHIIEITMDTAESRRPEVEVPTWDTLAQFMDDAQARGFSGTVLIVRDGETVLHQGYGFADRQRKVPNRRETIFAVGSVPIDFTHAAILALEDQGKLSTQHRIRRYLDGVPADKQDITLHHLMSGTSGLPNFHHVPDRDDDPDLTWIDRTEAVRRILGKELIFEPGQGEAHSHSAWTLLAALVEVISGQPYEQFLKQTFFEPLGMKHTGSYESARRMDRDKLAVGYEGMSVGEVNSPAHWGKTSWLVMGSGGMVSNPGDLYKWHQGTRSGKVLSPASTQKFARTGVAAGSNDRGFLCMFNQGSPALVFLCSNASGGMRDDVAKAVGRGLVRLASPNF